MAIIIEGHFVTWLLLLSLVAAAPEPQSLLPKALPCSLNNIALVGGDLAETSGGGGVQADSAEDCAGLCEGIDECRFWTHVDEWEAGCFLKSVAGEERDLSGAVTGWKGSGCSVGSARRTPPPPPPPTTTTTEEPQRLSVVRRRRPRPSAQGGGGSAGRRRQQRPRRPQPEEEEPVREAPERPLQGLLDNSGCTFDDVALLGGDLPRSDGGDGINALSFVECRAACRARAPTCGAFTYVDAWRQDGLSCFLKSSAEEESEFIGAVSGTLAPCSSRLARPPSPSVSSVAGVRNPFRQRTPEVAPVAARPLPSAPAPPSFRPFTTSNDRGRACLFTNTNFLGGGLSVEEGGQGIETPDHHTCSDECISRPQCSHWTFVQKWKVNCYLKSRLGEKSEFEDGVSGTYGSHCDELEEVKQTSFPVLDPSQAGKFGSLTPASPNECLFENTNFLGGGLTAEEGGQGIETKGYQACSLECQKRSKCSHWTFVEKWKVNCYLKSRLGEATEFEAVSGTYGSNCDELGKPLGGSSSAPQRSAAFVRSSRGSTKTGDLCLFRETNFLGGGLPESEGGQGIATKDHDQCDKECRNRGSCHYWTFVEAWRVNCYLKSRLGEKTDFEGGVSGTYGSNCDALNGPAASAPSAPVRQTQPSSLASPLFTGDEKLVPDGGGCRYRNTNLQGGDLDPEEGGHGIETRDADHCRNECADRPRCQFWTFVPEWKVGCYLKDKKGPEREMKNAVSGSLLLSCDQDLQDQLGEIGEPRDNEHECAYVDLGFDGADLPAREGGLGVASGSPESCRTKCLNSRYCKHWMHISGWRVDCYLKGDRVTPQQGKVGTVSGSVGVRCLPGATNLPSDGSVSNEKIKISAPLLSRPTDNTKSRCQYPGLNYQGGDLPDSQGGNGLEAPTPAECANECERQPTCSFWTHIDGWKVGCYLKSTFDSSSQKEGATSGSIGVTCDENYIAPVVAPSSESSEKTSSTKSDALKRKSEKVPKKPTSQPDNVCFFSDVNITGGDLPAATGGDGVTSVDANACAVLCYKNDDCVYFVWVKGWTVNCFLKTHFTAEEHFPGAVSGSIGLACE